MAGLQCSALSFFLAPWVPISWCVAAASAAAVPVWLPTPGPSAQGWAEGRGTAGCRLLRTLTSLVSTTERNTFHMPGPGSPREMLAQSSVALGLTSDPEAVRVLQKPNTGCLGMRYPPPPATPRSNPLLSPPRRQSCTLLPSLFREAADWFASWCFLKEL